jgi:hypothetical protein
MLLISLVFCVVFLVGSMTACCSSLLFSVLWFWWGPWLCVVFMVGCVTPCCSYF